jgi:hypothetical protein
MRRTRKGFINEQAMLEEATARVGLGASNLLCSGQFGRLCRALLGGGFALLARAGADAAIIAVNTRLNRGQSSGVGALTISQLYQHLNPLLGLLHRQRPQRVLAVLQLQLDDHTLTLAVLDLTCTYNKPDKPDREADNIRKFNTLGAGIREKINRRPSELHVPLMLIFPTWGRLSAARSLVIF